MYTFDSLLEELELEMMESLQSCEHDLAALRTGKASPTMVENIMVDYYGAMTRLREIAGITVPEPRMLVIQPWDQNAVQPIEKAIMASNLGIRPLSDGRILRLPIPELSEERRRDLIKQVHRRSEEAKVALRTHRREANEVARKGQKAVHMPEDELKLLLEKIQGMTDLYSGKVDDALQRKEKELMIV
jgi:ribosome recycling factor